MHALRSLSLSARQLTTGFLTFYSLIAVQMCNFASSNATAIFTLTAAIAMTSLVVAPKRALRYRIVVRLAESGTAGSHNGYVCTLSLSLSSCTR